MYYRYQFLKKKHTKAYRRHLLLVINKESKGKDKNKEERKGKQRKKEKWREYQRTWFLYM